MANRGRDGVPIVAIVAVIVLVAAAGAGAVLLLGGHNGAKKGSAPAARSKASVSVAGQGNPVQTTAGGAGTTTAAPLSVASRASAQAAIVAVLGGYQTTYSDHDTSGLAQLLTPGVIRHGLTSAGCRFDHGRSTVLDDYQSQFASGSGTYRLLGLTPSGIEFRGPDVAHVNSRYQISPGGTGTVSFTMAREGDEWKISQVYATCA
jgi:hypothetical protein